MSAVQQVQQDRIALDDGLLQVLYRNLIPVLATKYRVIAPNLPGFGFTNTPQEYAFNFDNLSKTIESFIDALHLANKPFLVYIFDYGAPVARRILSRRAKVFSTIVTQNGNAYDSGIAPAWDEFGIKKYWREPTKTNRDSLRDLLSLSNTKFQYTHGHPDPDSIPPETYYLDHFLAVSRTEAMLDLLGDYKTNIDLYPTFQKALNIASS